VATLDQLPAEQRAIIELVVQRGQTYDELAGMLDISPARVRQLAREALIELAPVSARRVDDDRRGQLADYVLGQQLDAERIAAQAHLRRSEAGRAWTSSLIDSLAALYPGEPPDIPEAEAEPPPRRRERARPRERDRVRDRAAREPPRERRPAREPRRTREPRRPARAPLLSPEAQAAVRRRRIAGLLLAGLVVAGIVLGILLITGGDDKKKTAKAAPAQTRIIGELLLKPVGSASRSNQGIAIVAQRSGQRPILIVQAKLAPSRQGQAYEVWLYNSRTDATAVGAQVTQPNGDYRGAGALPADITRFRYIDVSLQVIPDDACQRNPTCLRRSTQHSGNSVLRGRISEMQAPGPTGATGTTGPTGPTGP